VLIESGDPQVEGGALHKRGKQAILYI
jgi:hypothetical protein